MVLKILQIFKRDGTENRKKNYFLRAVCLRLGEFFPPQRNKSFDCGLRGKIWLENQENRFPVSEHRKKHRFEIPNEKLDFWDF